ncbi:unnamed protein product, partial [Didymodactylos carnosus]
MLWRFVSSLAPTLFLMVPGIASLEHRTSLLDTETWRLNAVTGLHRSVWGELIDLLKLDHSETTRQSLYKLWHLNRHNICQLVEEKKRGITGSECDGNDVDIDRTEGFSVLARNNSSLHSNPSLPVPQGPNTRARKQETADDVKTFSADVSETSFVLTPIEWKNAFSRFQPELKRITPPIVGSSKFYKKEQLKPCRMNNKWHPRDNAGDKLNQYFLSSIVQCTSGTMFSILRFPSSNQVTLSISSRSAITTTSSIFPELDSFIRKLILDSNPP